MEEPRTLQEAILYFSDLERCLDYLVHRRPEWKNGVICPRCGSDKVNFLKNQLRWQCSSHHARRQFSVKVDTLFEDSPIGLNKWLSTFWMLMNSKNGVASHEVARAFGVAQKTAWFMLHRLRLAMQDKHGGKLGGPGKGIEVDESFIGGKSRNMHKARRVRVITGTGGKDKAIVMGMLERGGNVRTVVMDNRRKKAVQEHVRQHIEAGSAIFTDELRSYDGLSDDYKHAVIDHAVQYADGNVHTNAMENFWSLLKRGLHGTYISVEPFHLFRYLDEQACRYNHRKMTDAERFDLAVRHIVGKRLTYKELTGKVPETTTLH